MRERRRADPQPIRDRAAVADRVVPVGALRALDVEMTLAGRHDRTPADVDEVMDQRLDVVHRAILDRRRRERVPRLVVAGRHVLDALLDDAQALADLLGAHGAAVEAIAVLGDWDVELELLVARVWPRLAEVPVEARGAQVRAGHAPVDRLLGRHRADADGAGAQNAV